MRTAIIAIMPRSTTLPFRKAWEHFIKGLSTHILPLHRLDLRRPCCEKSSPKEAGFATRVRVITVLRGQMDAEWWGMFCHNVVRCKVPREIKFIRCLSFKANVLKLVFCNPRQRRVWFDWHNFPGTSLGVTTTAICPLFLSTQSSSPLKIETHGQLAQLFGSSQVFSPIVLLFVYRLLMPELCTLRWGRAPELFPNA